MIEEVSWPLSLADWDPREQPFYLEFYGEAEPLLDVHYGEVVKAGKNDAESRAEVPVYRYWWTIGHAERRDPMRTDEAEIPWKHLDDEAAVVYVYFPIDAGWRAKEIATTLDYLSPVKQQHDWFEAVGKDFQMLQPLVGDASSIAGLVPGGTTASKWLDTIAQLKVSSVPQTKGFDWSVSKVTFKPKAAPDGTKRGVRQGVEWRLPRAVFEDLGGRITGSLAVSFIPAKRQAPGARDDLSGTILAHASVREDNGEEWLLPDPGSGHRVIGLKIAPQLPPQQAPA